MIGPHTTLRAALDGASATLADAGIEDPQLEARQLLMAALECTLSHLVLNEQAPLGEAAPRVATLLARRAAREPLSRILGRREFAGLDFALGPETLDPRPDTEVLVEAAQAALAGHPAPHLLDLGTGTGAILLALLQALPRASGIGIDISPGAASVARANASTLGLAARAGFLVGDLFAPLAAGTRFDAILSNPPYIPTDDLAGLDPEVRLFDPARALDGGTDGLDFYRRITQGAGVFLAPGGLLAFEVGQGQAGAVDALLTSAGFEAIETRQDLSGTLRVVLGRTPRG